MRKVFLGILVIFFIIPLTTRAQSIINGIVNTYYKVTEIHTDYIQIENGTDLSTLYPGDKVVLIQMTGVDVQDNAGFETGGDVPFTNLRDAGRYKLLAVSGVDDGTDRVTVTVTLDESDYTTGEKIQLVKIFETDYATVNGTLTASEWDGNTGGVLALVIFKKLTLNADINLNYRGFRGADPELIDPMECRPYYDPDTSYFQPALTGRAGRKGEGNIKTAFNYPTGPGKVVTGGGGGLGYFAGGGGGSHSGSGGNGGRQKQDCVPHLYATGGLQLFDYNFYGYDRVTMGGGGGSSTEGGTYSGIKGGDGGGIVIILADTIAGNNYYIFDNGESIVDATAGGSGGGAGGAILLDVNVFLGNLNLRVQGGKGGNSNNSNPYFGAGGGGGGGIIWHAGSNLPVNVLSSYARGSGGTSAGLGDYNGTNGTTGTLLANLELPLNGFLFNSLVGPDTICAGMVPGVIRGSMPKGGSTYTYTWLQSTDSITWVNAVGTGDLLRFYPSELVLTTYYTRVVESYVDAQLITDMALPIKIYVHDSIEGNILNIRDTLCSQDSPGILSGGVLSGGNGTFQYLWQSSTNQVSWSPRATTPSFDEGNLLQSTYYRRIATSARVCVDTSKIDTLSVIPLISNNMFLRADTAICFGLDAGTVKASLPLGGDSSYRYEWQESNDNIDFGTIGGAESQNYSPGILTQDKYYKRIVYSGADDACTNTTASSFPIVVYDAIGNNTIQTDPTLYCAGDIPNPITGTLPTGGDGSDYTYTWQARLVSESWMDIPGETGISYSPALVEDSIQVRRVVESGLRSTCVSNSNTIQIDVIPYIMNELVSQDSAVCEGSVPLPFNEQVATGGAGIDGYLWESQPVSGGSWQPASGTNNLPSYSPGELTLSTRFRRAVSSQICTDYSDPVTIIVYDLIVNNTIVGGSLQYTCYNTEKELTGNPDLQGGKLGDIRYNWEKSLETLTWEPADGTNTTENYTSPALTDTLFFRRIVLSGEYNQCMDTTDAVLVRINSLPSGDIISGIDTACAGSTITVQYTGLQGHAPWTIVLGDTGPVHTETGIITTSGEIVFPVSESGQIVLLDLIDYNTCHADLTSNTGVVDLTVFEVPVAEAGNDAEVCGLVNNLSAIPSIGVGTWSGNGAEFTNVNDPETQVEVGTYGSYTFYWTEMNWQCTSTNQTEVIFYEQPEVPNAGEDQQLDFQFETILEADPPPPGMTGYWSFISENRGALDDSSLYNTRVSFPSLGTYELIWTLISGVCSAATNKVTITINDLQPFTGFSPNDDGVNDTYRLKLSGRYDVELIILDRWGNKVFSDNGISEITWDGKNSDGVEMPEGTYFYIIKGEDLSSNKEGYIELRR